MQDNEEPWYVHGVVLTGLDVTKPVQNINVQRAFFVVGRIL